MHSPKQLELHWRRSPLWGSRTGGTGRRSRKRKPKGKGQMAKVKSRASTNFFQKKEIMGLQCRARAPAPSLSSGQAPRLFQRHGFLPRRKSTETSYLSGELHKPLWQFVSEWRRGRQFIDLCHKIKSRKKGNGKMNA